MSNNDIVLYIHKNIDIDKFIIRSINNSELECNYEDLKQYIYLILLQYDNKKLNNLYEQKVLPQFIMQIILNQRNYYKSYYTKYLKVNNNSHIGICSDIEDEEYDEGDFEMKLKFIEKELGKYIGKRNNLTSNQEYEMICYELYRFLIKRDLTIKELSFNLKLGYRKTIELINYAKINIKNKYKK